MVKLMGDEVLISPYVNNEKFEFTPHKPPSRARWIRSASLPIVFILTSLLVVLTTFSLQPPGTLSTIFAFFNVFAYRAPLFSPHLVHRPSREAYATMLSDVKLDPMYLLQTRLLLYQLRHDPHTADLSRDFVILTTPLIPDEVEYQLRAEGAVVIRRPLIEHMPGDKYLEGRHRWKDQYSKLNIFNLVEYERILYMDSDTILTRALADLWEEETSWPLYGLSSVGVTEEVAVRPAYADGSEFNAGFWMAQPSKRMFEDLLRQQEFDSYYLEQALLNHYFDWEGDRPWTEMDQKWNKINPTDEDLTSAFATLHGHFWEIDHETKLGDYWLTLVDKMEKYWYAKETSGLVDWTDGR